MTGGAARAHGADELFVVEAPEVLHRAAAATDHDQVDAGDGVGLLQAVDHRARAAFALHAGGHEPRRPAPAARLEHLGEVMPDGADLRRHERDDLGEVGQGPLERLVEEPFGLQLVAQLLELLEEVALAGRLDRVDDQRHLAGLAVEIRLGLGHDLLAFAQRLLEPAGLEGVQHAVHLGFGVLEREVVVAGRVGLVARDLTRHLERSHPVEVSFEDIRELADGEGGRGHVGRFGDLRGEGKRGMRKG